MLEGAGPAGDAEVVWWRFGLLRVAAQRRGRARASGGRFMYAYTKYSFYLGGCDWLKRCVTHLWGVECMGGGRAVQALSLGKGRGFVVVKV